MRLATRLSASLLPIALGLTSRDASACGAAYPGGPVMCDYPRRAGAPTNERPVARVSSSYAFTSTTLLFDEGRADLTRHAAFGAIEIPLAKKGTTSLIVGAGGVAGGELTHGLARDAVGPGFSAFVGIAKRIYDGEGALPFVQLTGTFSTTHMLTRTSGVRTDGSLAPIETPRYTAFDFRFGAIAGKTFGDVFTPYAVGRFFGGPILWKLDGNNVVGTDMYKVQLGGGLSLALFDRRVDLFVEGIGLGERGVAAGLGTTFF
ncbi:MAG: hypothetical protein KF819_27710 [Labilithrix sp.]|nr:hypothetical protein [Labilithrix sp.]